MITRLLLSILIISGTGLLIVYMKYYTAEVHIAMALPLAIVAGLSAIAVAINEKK